MTEAEAVLQEKDLQQIAAQGMKVTQVHEQIEIFRRGLPFLQLERPCTVNDGILALTVAERDRFIELFSQASNEGRVTKFVPASGAASRMFQLLLSVLERGATLSDAQIVTLAQNGDAECRAVLQFVQDLQTFAFYDDLRVALAADGLDLQELRAQRQCKAILQYCLTPRGLNYARLPKALIKFHRYPEAARASLEEHLVEAAEYARDTNGVARIHFTVSSEHEEPIRAHIERVRSRYEKNGLAYTVSFSIQKPSTDTIAVDRENNPFRDEHGSLVFRPGGHGALLENLQETGGDIVFIKNIDNVVPDGSKEETYRSKQALGGLLVDLQNATFAYLRALKHHDIATLNLGEIVTFTEQRLGVAIPSAIKQGSQEALRNFLIDRLHRPLRVCGVVQNTGEPGGGPFWVKDATGTTSRQIVESSQVDLMSVQQRNVWQAATHFNPVDLVCGIRDYQGNLFDLGRFVDPETGFISRKSKDGKELKALELPGLWNGAMAKWNTVFVEVPAITFNPVKTVFDLLRPEHQTEVTEAGKLGG